MNAKPPCGSIFKNHFGDLILERENNSAPGILGSL